MPYYRHSHHPCNIDHRSKEQGHWDNKPFYSCGHNTLAFEWMWGWDGPYLNTKPPLFSYRNCAWKILVSIRTTWFSTRKQRELYQNKVNSSLVPIYFELRDNLRLEQVPERCIKEQVTYTSANSLTQWREYRQNTVLSFYLTILSFHYRKSSSFCINFLLFGSPSLCIRLKSLVFICLSVNIL